MRSPLLSLALVLPLFACSGSTSTPSPDDAGGADASVDAAADSGAIACAAPLSESADLDTAPIATWCARGSGRGSRTTNACDGYYLVVIGEGVDCSTQYFFDATTKKLVAETHDCNLQGAGVCTQGPSSFTPPSLRCFDHGFTYVDACAARDASAD